MLALDGPGQAECRVLGLTVSMENWTAVGKAAVDWLVARPETTLWSPMKRATNAVAGRSKTVEDEPPAQYGRRS